MSTALDRSVPLPAAALAQVRGARRSGRRRVLIVSSVLGAATLVIAVLSMRIGSFPIPAGDLVRAVFGSGPERTVYIVQELRMPRALVGVLVGVAFGLSGAVFQTLARNPLASPDIIGVTAGASLGAVFVFTVIGPFNTLANLAALAGSAAAALLIFTLSAGRGSSVYRLILVGIGVQAVVAACIEFLFTRARENTLQQLTTWLTGSLNARSWTHVVALAAALAVLLPVLLRLSAPVRGLQLGDETAGGIGVRVGPSRIAVTLVGCALAAAGVAAAGPIALVSFLGPPIARRLVRSPGPAFLPSAIVAAFLLVSADALARVVLGDTALPVGLVTGAIGAPYLVILLARANKAVDGG